MRARTLLSSQPSLALAGPGEAAGRLVGCLGTRAVGHTYQAQVANPGCSAGFVALGEMSGFDSGRNAAWLPRAAWGEAARGSQEQRGRARGMDDASWLSGGHPSRGAVLANQACCSHS